MKRVLLAGFLALTPFVPTLAQQGQAPAIKQLQNDPAGGRAALGLPSSSTIDTTNASNISSGTLPAGRLPNPTSSALGGVRSFAQQSHCFVNTISTSGIPGCAQPSAADVSGLAASATTDATNASNISSGTLDAARLPAAGTAGTYIKVTTDAAGRVTSGTSLSSGDVTTALGYSPVNPSSIGTAASKNVGVSVLDPGTGALESLLPVQTLAATSKTFGSADLYKETRRSNSGAAMSDTFPAASTTGLVNGTRIVTNNVDATAIDTITAGAGTTINSGSSAAVTAGRSVTWVYDLANTMWRSTLNGTTVALTSQPNTFAAVQTMSAGLNVTTATGYQLNGNTLIASQGGTGYMVAGIGAGLPTAAGNETAIFGNFINKNGNAGIQDAYFGDFVAGYETNGSYSTGVGNDAFRNANGLSGNVAIGKSSQATNFAPRNISVGFQSMIGAAANVTLSGTPSTTGTVQVTVAAAGLSGSPITITANVTASEPLATIVNDLAVAMSSDSRFFSDNIYPQTLNSIVNLAPVFAIGHQGTNVAGVDNMTVTVAVTSATGLSATAAYASTAAVDNIGIGTFAMAGLAVTTATNDIAIGQYSLASATTATNVVAIGGNAGNNITTASDVVVIGNAAGSGIAGANQVTAVGSQAGGAATGGAFTALGYRAGLNFSSGSGRSTFIGNSAGSNIGNAFGNTFVGNSAGMGATNSTSGFNTAVGDLALQSISGGNGRNHAFGEGAGNKITTGGYNILWGYTTAGSTLTTGSDNIMICTGHVACDTAASGTSDTFVLQGNNASPFLSATGTNAPTTSTLTIAGLAIIGGAGTTVASLPTCNGASKGARTYVTDANSPTYLGALTGGGSAVSQAFCTGAGWISAANDNLEVSRHVA